MKFKDLPSGEIFTYWDQDRHHTAIKIGEQGTSERERAVCLDTGEIVDVHANKDVKKLDIFDETLQYKVGRDGQGYLCSPLPGGKVLARRILLLTGGMMSEEQFKKPVSTRKDGGDPDSSEQVYIMWQMAQKKLAELEKVLSVVGILIQDGLSPSVSDNKIMSTSPGIVGRALTE